jgi:hypothetical protein
MLSGFITETRADLYQNKAEKMVCVAKQKVWKIWSYSSAACKN